MDPVPAFLEHYQGKLTASGVSIEAEKRDASDQQAAAMCLAATKLEFAAVQSITKAAADAGVDTDA